MAVILITGCSSGFGEAIAHGFLRRGDTVVASMRRPDAAPASFKTAAEEAAPRLSIAPLDVTDAASRAAAIEETLARNGRLDVLVNNAGVGAFGSLEDTPLELVRHVFETNFFGAHEMIRLTLPVMRRQGAGRIINVTAMGAVFSTPLLSAYCASKHALDSVSAGADIEARNFGVRVISVLPGQFKTAIAEKSVAAAPSPPYASVAAAMTKAREENVGDVMSDLSPVVDTIIEAANTPDPHSRYVVGRGMAEMLAPVIAELEKLHQFDLQRAGAAEK